MLHDDFHQRVARHFAIVWTLTSTGGRGEIRLSTGGLTILLVWCSRTLSEAALLPEGSGPALEDRLLDTPAFNVSLN